MSKFSGAPAPEILKIFSGERFDAANRCAIFMETPHNLQKSVLRGEILRKTKNNFLEKPHTPRWWPDRLYIYMEVEKRWHMKVGENSRKGAFIERWVKEAIHCLMVGSRDTGKARNSYACLKLDRVDQLCYISRLDSELVYFSKGNPFKSSHGDVRKMDS
jgi:hypothetical protein